MKIFKIEIENFRLLKIFSLDLEDKLSLVIGKNNTGKTSILSVLNKFLNSSEKNRFTFDDFNIDFRNDFKALIVAPEIVLEEEFTPLGISLKLYIKYDEKDDLSNISRVMMDLDPNNNFVVLGFEFTMNFHHYQELKNDYFQFSKNEASKKKKREEKKEKYTPRDLDDFMQQKVGNYFKVYKKSYEYNYEKKSLNKNNYIDLKDEESVIKEIISFKYISARRDVTNKEIDKTLSGQTSRIYKSTEANEEQNEAVEDFKDKLLETDTHLSGVYKTLFDGVIKKIKNFGGIKVNESEIEIISTLKHRELLEGNTTVVYKHDANNHLPEHYNGLGYMNLISMIFEIEILVHEFKREKEKKLADINLLFIEEPEAHTHPQMQYVFIKNIKNLLGAGIIRDDGEHRSLQYIISTHSSCIVADSDFDDIKYLKKENSNKVIAKNIKDLRHEYDKTPQYQFLRQYLTISRAEVFFADKVVLIEGDTERILVPTLMRKFDLEEQKKHSESEEKDKFLPLLSQNISIIEVGAYSQIFEKFIDFLGIKTLIVTDLDAVDDDGKKCEVSKGKKYSNAALNFFFSGSSIDVLRKYGLENKVLKKDKDKGLWVNVNHGNLCIVYQIEENGYNARSFEDAFININMDFICAKIDNFEGLKNREHFTDKSKNSYYLADECIKKKTHFALDILYHSNDDLSNWQIPAYIKEGLQWLKKD